MTKKKHLAFAAAVLLFLVMWFSHFLPTQIAKGTAVDYLSAQEDGEEYHITDADFSGPFDSYFVYFENETGEMRNIGVRYRYLPFAVWFDSHRPHC